MLVGAVAEEAEVLPLLLPFAVGVAVGEATVTGGGKVGCDFFSLGEETEVTATAGKVGKATRCCCWACC